MNIIILFSYPKVLKCCHGCFPGQSWECYMAEGGVILLHVNFIEYFEVLSKGSLCECLIQLVRCGNIWTGLAFQLPGPERLAIEVHRCSLIFSLMFR